MTMTAEETAHHLSVLDTCNVGELMTQSVLVANADWQISELAEFLVSNGISGAPVVDEHERVIGVVSVTDIARHTSMNEDRPGSGYHQYYTDTLAFSLDNEEYIDYRRDDEDTTIVRNIMTPAVFDVDIHASVRLASSAMIKNRIHRVMVSDKGKLVGIVSALDILALLNRS